MYSKFTFLLGKKSHNEFFKEMNYLSADDACVAIAWPTNEGVIVSKTPEVDSFLRLKFYNNPKVKIEKLVA